MPIGPDIRPGPRFQGIPLDQGPVFGGIPLDQGPQTYDPTSGMSTGDLALAGMGRAFTDIGRGVKDIGLEARAALADQGADLGLVDPETAQRYEQSSADYDRAIAEARERDQPLMETNPGFYGNLAGHGVAALAPGSLVRNTLGGAIKAGAVYGAAQPTAGDESRVINTALSAGGGAAGHGLVSLGSAVAGLPSRAMEPLTTRGQEKIVGRVLRREAGDQVDDVVRAMRGAPELVPGSQPTAGQASGSGGIASLERAIASIRPQHHARRMLEQNAARINALDEAAGNPAARAAAVQARSQGTAPLLNQVARSTAKVDTTRIRNLLSSIQQRNPGRKQLVSALDDIKQGLDFDDPQSLKSVSQNIGDMMSAKGPTGAKINEAIVRELAIVKRSLDRQIAKAEPAYGQYMRQFRELSKPINQIDTGQEVVKRATTPTVDAMGNPTVTPRAMNQTLRSGDQIARRATGFKRARMEDTLSPEQLQTFRAVADDLSRAQVAQNLGRGPGSNTVQNLAMSNLMGSRSGVGPPTLLSRPAMIANYIRRVAYDKADQDMQDQLLDALLDPNQAASLMEGAAPGLAEDVLTPLTAALRRIGAAGGAVAPQD